jgi:two-component system, chemotaxis family, sensor histidine kinase and response regulator PixL
MQDKELEIRSQFLDEAQDYLDALDAAVLDIADQQIDAAKVNAALRAAHSIKGGAGMMGFHVLSDLAHRLEDSFKVLKVDRSIIPTTRLENLLLSAIAGLRQVADYDREMLGSGQTATSADQVALDIEPIFDQLHEQLGEPQEETAGSILSPEEGQDIIPLLFETEVEGCLERLEGVLANPNQPCLAEEVKILAQELGGLGEMLQLPAFSRLCLSVEQALETEDPMAIAQAALNSWRRAQAVVLIGQYDSIPDSLELGSGRTFAPNIADQEVTLSPELEGDISFDDFAALTDNPFPGITEPVAVDTTESNEDWFTTALSSDEVAVDDFGFTETPSVVEEPVAADEPKVGTGFKLKDDPAPEEDLDATVRVPVRQLNVLNDLFGELTIDRNGLDLYIKRLRNLAQILRDRITNLDEVNANLRTTYDKVAISTQGSRSLLGNGSTNGSIDGSTNSQSSAIVPSGRTGFDTLEMDQYGDLHLLSQQVMETIVQLQETAEDIDLTLDDTDQSNRNLTKTSRQLQSGLSQLRMRPLSDVLDRFPRAVREWSLQYNKRVRLNVVGGNTLVDRNVLETLNDPLMHILRNAFDHGIEDPMRRSAEGKSPEGVIEIRAEHQGNRTVIKIQDDGKGIPIDKIRDRAAQMGLDPVLLAAARDEELLSLIFEPGFTTQDQVTALSGRGVGMDVVRSNLKQIRGDVAVDTRAGLGTTFTLSVPFTLSTLRILLVECYGMLLAFPTEVVVEMFLMQSDRVIQTAGSEVVNWQNQMVQLVRLQKWFRFNCPRPPHGFETPPTISSPSVVIVNQNEQLFGIQIDRCWGEQEVTLRRVESNLTLPAGFSSCTILGDGRVIPLVSVGELLRWVTSCERSGVDPVASYRMTAQQHFSLAASSVPTILVVDDSINVRRFLALTLERAGYRVEQAKDGQDALERLENGLSVQAIICDIEMPRLDGFGFLARAKNTPDLKQVPVVMLTSRSGEKHRKLAESLGASAYFSKPYNEQILLRSIEQMVSTTTKV